MNGSSERIGLRISFRITSAAVLVAFAASPIISHIVPVESPAIPQVISPDGTTTISFNPCDMWEQLAWRTRLSVLFWFGSLLFLIVQGLRNRPVRRWWPVSNLIAYAGVLEHELWSLKHCYSIPGLVSYWLFISATIVMCIHQLLPRREIGRISKTVHDRE